MFGYEVNHKKKHISDHFKLLGIFTSKLGILNIKYFDNIEKCINNEGYTMINSSINGLFNLVLF